MATGKVKTNLVKNIPVTHGTINAGNSSTVTTSGESLPETAIIAAITVSGNYNSDIVSWSHYVIDGQLVSRVKNTGSNQASNIVVTYKVVIPS